MKRSVLFEMGWTGKLLLYMNLEQTHEGGEEESHMDLRGVRALRGGGVSASPLSAEHIVRG